MSTSSVSAFVDVDFVNYFAVPTSCMWFCICVCVCVCLYLCVYVCVCGSIPTCTENGMTIVIWVGSRAPNEFISKVFGVGSQAQVDPDMVRMCR